MREHEKDCFAKLKEQVYHLKTSEGVYFCPFCSESKEYQDFTHLLQHAMQGSSEWDSSKVEEHSALARYMNNFPEEPTAKNGSPSVTGGDLKFDCRLGILANIPRKGESASSLEVQLKWVGFAELLVHPLWTNRLEFTFAIVKFLNESDARRFEKYFKDSHRGRSDYFSTKSLIDHLYGWLAGEADYWGDDIVGIHLRKHGKLRTVSDKHAEDGRRDEMVSQKDEMANNFLAEGRVCITKLYGQKKRLEEREEELNLQEFKIKSERKELELAMERIKTAIMDRIGNYNEGLKLTDNFKEEDEDIQKQLSKLEKGVKTEKTLEWEIHLMREDLTLKKHLGGGNEHIAYKEEELKKIEEGLKGKEEHLKHVKAFNQTEIGKMNNIEDEVQKTMMVVIQESRIVIHSNKSMEEFSEEPFPVAGKKKIS